MENKYGDEGYYVSFPDPLLSRKLLRFSDYPDVKTINQQTIDSEISKVIYNYKSPMVPYYKGVTGHKIKQPVYYQGKRRSETELRKFRHSEKFPIFLRELEQCIAYLNHWITAQGLTIELNDRSAQANGGLASIPAEEELKAFFTRLKSENFVEFDTDLYADGKKYLEKLALLVRNDNIDLTFRKNQIISLLSDQGLRRCVGGCLAILDMAVSNLENYGDYQPDRLITRFFLDILKQSAVHSTQLNGANVISKISKIVSVDRDMGEIHIYNYLFQQAKRVFNLRFLILVEDPHVSFVTGPYHADPAIREKINSVLENDYINPIKHKLRTADLVYFISNQLREKLEVFSDNSLEKLAKLKGWLSELGNDPYFNQKDFFNDEYRFKLDTALERTITERLFNTGWLELDLSRESRLLNEKHFFFKRNSALIDLSSQARFPFEAFSTSYRVYYSNLELNWITIDGEKQRVLDFIQQEGGLKHLDKFFQKSPEILVNVLIQTPHDMNLFFQALAIADLSLGLQWINAYLSKNFVTPSDGSVIWMSRFTDDANRYAKILESVDYRTQKKLFVHLIEQSQPFSIKLQTILNELAEIPNTRQTDLYTIMMKHYEVFYEILNNLSRLDIKDFSGIVFPAFHCKKCLFSLNSPILTYLSEIDFSGYNLDKAVFNAYIRNCQFNKASLDGTTFKKSVASSSFEQTDLSSVQFQGENFFDLKLNAAKFSTATFLALVKATRPPGADFKGADLRQVDFQNRRIQRELVHRVIDFNDALLQNTDLSGVFKKESNIVLLEGANLDGAKLSKCNLARIHPTSRTSMRNVITDQTILSPDQLFKLYRQGNRDFSTDFIIDWDPKTTGFSSETLAGAHLSYPIVLTLMSNGFTNFDQAQWVKIHHHQKSAPTFLTSKTLKDRTQRARLERLEVGQHKYQELQQIISETLNHGRQTTKLKVLNQANLLHSDLFIQKHLEIQGQCVQLTAGFSEAIIRAKQAIYKNNLYVVSQWDKRLIQHKSLSVREVSERNNFLKCLKQFEPSEQGPVHLTSWSYDKSLQPVNIEALIANIDFAKQQFAWHVNLLEVNRKTGHVLGIYNIDGKYTYFDSNVGYVDNINDREIFIRFLQRIIKKSYLIHRPTRIVIDQYLPSSEFIQNPTANDPLEKALFSILLTERQRLSFQDASLGYLLINRQLVKRTQLYDIGFSYHRDGNLDLPGQLLDAEMRLEQNFLDKSLLSKKFSINSHDFKENLLNFIQKKKKSIINPTPGGDALDYVLRTMRELSRVPNYSTLKSPLSTQSLTPLFAMSDSHLERRMHLRSIEKLLKKDIASSEQFTLKLEQNQFQKGIVEGLQGIRKKIPGPKALSGLIASKSLFDIGISLSQNNRQAALLQSLMLSYGLFAEPWVEQSIIKLPKKFAHFVNYYSPTFKISDKILNAKKIVIPTRLFAGTAANVLDVVSLAHSINLLMEAEYGTKDWRDAIADMTIDSASLLTGAAVVAFQASFGFGIGIGVVLIIVKSGYDGSSLLAEYSAYNLTFAESAQTFFRGTIRLAASEQVQYLRNRQDQIDNMANHYWKKLQAMNEKLPIPVAAYGGGLGEYTKNNPRSYQENTLDPVNDKIRKINRALGVQGKIPLVTQHDEDPSPGISDILPFNSHPFKKNLSRLTPKKPDAMNSHYLCLPASRNESIETFKQTIAEVNFQCVNAVVILNKTQVNDLNETINKKAVLDMEYVYDGIIQKIPDFDNTFYIFNGTTHFFANSTFGSPSMDTFFIKSSHFSGYISLDFVTNSLLILEDNSDIRTHSITLLANNDLMMAVIAEKYNGDIEGRFITKNFGFVMGRQQKQDKYNCHLPPNNMMDFFMQLQGGGGPLKHPDIYTDCPHVILHASSHYHLTKNSNQYTRYGWGSATISIDADQPGIIIITPPTENNAKPELEVQAIHFTNLNLLQESRLRYCHITNKLVIAKEFASPLDVHNLESLNIELINYWNAIQKRSNYVLYDRYDNLITPLLSNEVIKTFQHSFISNMAECFYPQEYSLYQVLNITHHKVALQDIFSLITIEEALEGFIFNATILGPFTLNTHLKLLNFIKIYPYDYTLTISNSGKNIINLISSENKISSFYGSKDEDHYFINLNDIRGEKLIKINNYDPDINLDRLEIYTNHSSYELCIDQTTHVKSSNNFLFYILNRYEEAQTFTATSLSVCTGKFDFSWPHVAVILLQNYLLSPAYQHIEICVTNEANGTKCLIPFLDKDTRSKPIWLFKRYFRNSHEEIFFQLDPSFSDIVVEGDLTKFQAIQRKQDFILLKGKKDDSTVFNSFSLWFPAYYSNPAQWDLFHIYGTQNATAVDSRMHDIDNSYIRELSKITVDYSLLEHNLRFYELSLTKNNTVIDHNQLQTEAFRKRRHISSALPKIKIDIGYLEISKNESFDLVDVEVKREKFNLLFYIYMKNSFTQEITSFLVTVENWDKPQYRLAGLVHRRLTIMDLNQWDLDAPSLRKMQLHIHEQLLEHQINGALESDLKTMLIWYKLRIFLILPLLIKGYDIQMILHIMQKTLDFQNIEEVLTFLPEYEDSPVASNQHLKSEIAGNETITKKIKSLLLYHVAKASFPSQENTQQSVIDSFAMVPEFLISSIYTQMRMKLFNNPLSDVQAYMHTICSSFTGDVKLSEWLDRLTETSSQNVDHFLRQKVIMPLTASDLSASFGTAQVFRKKYLRMQLDDIPILTEAVTSSATRSEGWLNSFFKLFLEPFRAGVEAFLLRYHQPMFALAGAQTFTGNHQAQVLDRCIPGIWYGDTDREGITCYTSPMQGFIFPKKSNAKIPLLEDSYSKQSFRPIEFNSRPAVYFEGEKTYVFYVPKISENRLDQFNEQLVLLHVLFHEGKKFYGWCKNLFSGKNNPSQEETLQTNLTNEIKTSWKRSLDNLEKQLVDMNTFAAGTVDLRWINDILENRKKELHAMNQLSTENLETINAFTENLQALQAELVEIRMDLDSRINKQDKCKQKTNITNIFAYKPSGHRCSSLNKKSSVLNARGFFNTQFCKENISILSGNSNSRNFCINQ